MDDKAIVKLYWDRNEKAISVTVEKYGNYCMSIAKNILGNNEDAEECVNDAYLNAWNSIPPHKPSVLSVFLGKIVRNLSINRYKRNNALIRGGGELPLVLDELLDLVSNDENIDQKLRRSELVEALNSFLRELSPKKRSIFVCRYWYTDSISKIAAQHRINEGAVSMILSRLRKKLQEYLYERGFRL